MKTTLTLTLCLLFAAATFAQNTGGPDAYGYTWKDNTATGGPTYGWIDITTKGTQVLGLSDDNFKGPFSIGFDFQYYWTTTTEFWVGSNGYVSIDNGIQISSGGAVAFPAIPTADGMDNFLAPMLCDLSFGGGGNPGKCYYWSNNVDSCIISFEGVPFWNNASNYSGSNTFQIIMNGADNSITFQYATQTGTFDPAYAGQTNPVVIGIENNNGTVGLEHSNTVFPTTPIAIQFIYPDSVTFEVTDVRPEWFDNARGAFFMVKDVKSILGGNVSNVGNKNLNVPFDVNSQIYPAPSGAKLYDEDYTVVNMQAGTNETFTYGPTYTPQGAGSFQVFTSTDLSSDLNTGNDVIKTEMIVIDTVGQTTMTLDYTDGTSDELFGFEGGANYFTPPFYPVDIQSIEFFLWDIDSFAASTGFRAKIRDDDGSSGDPGTVLFDSAVSSGSVIEANEEGGQHVIMLASPVTITDGGFYVSWENVDTPIATRLLIDSAGPYSFQSYEVLSGTPAPYRNAFNSDLFISVTTDLPAPPAPTAPVAEFGANKFTAYIGDSITFFSHALTATSWAWAFESGSPATGTAETDVSVWSTVGTYDVTLTATNGVGSDDITKQVTIVDTVTGIFGPKQLSGMGGFDIKLFPNPARDQLIIESVDTKVERVAVYNTMGAQVFVQELNGNNDTHQIQLGDLPNGVYMLKAISGKLVQTASFVVIQ